MTRLPFELTHQSRVACHCLWYNAASKTVRKRTQDLIAFLSLIAQQSCCWERINPGCASCLSKGPQNICRRYENALAIFMQHINLTQHAKKPALLSLMRMPEQLVSICMQATSSGFAWHSTTHTYNPYLFGKKELNDDFSHAQSEQIR